VLYPYRSFSVLIVSPLLSTVARLCCTGTVVPAYFRPSATSSYLYLYRYICTGICRSLTVALDVNFPCMILTRTRPFRCVGQSRSKIGAWDRDDWRSVDPQVRRISRYCKPLDVYCIEFLISAIADSERSSMHLGRLTRPFLISY
jgi:hypothetical protein